MGFKENLKEELKFQDIKQKELSEKTGISVNTLRNYINDHNALPNIYSAVKIAKALNTTVEKLVDGTNPNCSDSEKNCIALFKKLSEHDRKSVIALMTEMCKP
ncbi:helix-turn-helix domain-containing protein [Treponema sp.]|jgi:transcriptional regulator with XRE-family HTH domain|uniref:helix-turn-helix domain-containing protein n=1 Tax=Treponema sp. TaxID=166 RepID=UPI0025CCBD77|nr:helix-turn-helix transcriptional regulator [Treponema sp.]MBR4322694.1 helix-turn-helix transcriptional regulator [Treponema sp.]